MLDAPHAASRSADKPTGRSSLDSISGDKELKAQPMVVETKVEMRKSLLDGQKPKSEFQFENKRKHRHSLLSDEPDENEEKYSTPKKGSIGPSKLRQKHLEPTPRMDIGMTEPSGVQLDFNDINGNGPFDQIPENPQHDEGSMELATSSKKAEDEPQQLSRKEESDSHKKKIYFTFIFLFVMNFIRVFDNGILPAMATTLKED